MPQPKFKPGEIVLYWSLQSATLAKVKVNEVIISEKDVRYRIRPTGFWGFDLKEAVSERYLFRSAEEAIRFVDARKLMKGIDTPL